jgi:hypothetical protein
VGADGVGEGRTDGAAVCGRTLARRVGADAEHPAATQTTPISSARATLRAAVVDPRPRRAGPPLSMAAKVAIRRYRRPRRDERPADALLRGLVGGWWRG